MIELKDVQIIHSAMLKRYGGMEGIRDQGILESAIARPYATFGGQDLYDSPVKKAAAILESIVKNHPFFDGNKRTGFVLMLFILHEAGIDLKASSDERYEFTIAVAEGRLGIEEIEAWIDKYKTPIE